MSHLKKANFSSAGNTVSELLMCFTNNAANCTPYPYLNPGPLKSSSQQGFAVLVLIILHLESNPTAHIYNN